MPPTTPLDIRPAMEMINDGVFRLAIGNCSPAAPAVSATSSQLEDDEDAESLAYDVIPERVSSQVPLKVMKSQIKRKGNSVIVVEGVKAGDLIFSVKQPLLNIVSCSRLL